MILKIFAEYPPRKRLGLVAILLGLISIFAGNPNGKTMTKINAQEISMISSKEITKIAVDELANDIIKSKFDYRLIDLRDAKDYSEYNIPSSENIEVDQILNSDLERNENILLYSDNDIESTQAWFLLKTQDYKGVNVLRGGIESWKKEILFPACSCNKTPTIEQKHKHDKLLAISKFFGGSMNLVSENNTDGQNRKMPVIKTPAKVTLKKANGKKKREGC